MKHPARYVSRRVQQVSRGRRALYRQVAAGIEKLREDPSFRRLVAEVSRYFIELVIRLTIVAAMKQCIQPGRERARVVTLRPKPVS
jgi:hypothetical protein